jgi:hypothetical protein
VSRPLATAVAVEVDRGEGRHTVVWLDNGAVRIGAVPSLGGRLLSTTFDGRETLWRDDRLLDRRLRPVGGHVPQPVSGRLGDWVNHGGDKTWPAPQGWSGPHEWAGPPDPVLDSGAYDWSVDDLPEVGVRLTMTSAADPRTWLRLTRGVTIAPGEPGYRLDLRATNVSARTVRWALWNVTQRRAGTAGTGGVDVGVGLAPTGGPVADVVPVVTGTGVPRHEVPEHGRVHVPHQDVVGKVGFPTATGWLAHAYEDVRCTLRFDPDPTATYPDSGSRAEVWMEHPLSAPLVDLGDLDPPDRIVEVEVLGPLVDLAPGASTDLSVRFDYAAYAADLQGDS